jgi:hypothetical protein
MYTVHGYFEPCGKYRISANNIVIHLYLHTGEDNRCSNSHSNFDTLINNYIYVYFDANRNFYSNTDAYPNA